MVSPKVAISILRKWILIRFFIPKEEKESRKLRGKRMLEWIRSTKKAMVSDLMNRYTIGEIKIVEEDLKILGQKEPIRFSVLSEIYKKHI